MVINDVMGVENAAQLIEQGIRHPAHLLYKIMRVYDRCKDPVTMKAVIGCV